MSSVASSRLMFEHGGAFLADLNARVERRLSIGAIRFWGRLQLYGKSAAAAAFLITGWGTLMFASPSLALGIGALAFIALGLTVVAFSVQHDANHGAYFSNRRYNHLLGWSADCLLCISSYAWRVKHNVAHHTYTNVFGYDDDVSQAPIAAFSPGEPPRLWHRYQHIYIWPLYGLMGARWQLAGDIAAFMRGKIGESRLRAPRGWDLAGLLVGRMIFFGWAVVAPLLVYPWWMVAVGYAAVTIALSFMMTVTFQLAHCVEEASFASPEELIVGKRRSWAVHEIESTVNFCPRNPILTWFLGGLNFQIEHHLFPRVPHTLYPRIAEVVRETCAEYGVRYTVHPNLWRALRSHCTHLYHMGQRGRWPAIKMG
jgi:linoleoyl-CoA desaturase